MPSHHLICGASKQAAGWISLAKLDRFRGSLKGKKATSVPVSSGFDSFSQLLGQKRTAFDIFNGQLYGGSRLTSATKVEVSKGKKGLEEGLGVADNLWVSLNPQRFSLPLGSMHCSQVIPEVTPSALFCSSSGPFVSRGGSIQGPTVPLRIKILGYLSQVDSLSTARCSQSSPHFASVSHFDVFPTRTISHIGSRFNHTDNIRTQFKLTRHRLFSTLPLHAQDKHAPPYIAHSAKRFSTCETSSASVSVRTPHGAGTEGLRKSTKGLQGTNPEGLQRIDTDRAAESASNNPSTVKDVLGGREKQAFTPTAPPPTDSQIQSLHDFIVDSESLLVVTGAGVSTESGIPDYRSPTGAYSTGFKPTTHQEFVRSAASRQRYWARSYFGWRRFSGTRPNETHRAIATLEERGRVRGGMITQNVDRLHHACGSDPLELHGTTHQVICMICNDLSDRQKFQEKLAATNPQWIDFIEAAERGEDVLAGTPGLQRPDGDVEIGEEFLRKGLFRVPVCEKCGADALKPDVVFFGDNVPKWRVDRAAAMVRNSDAMLVVGSSLMVLSAYRLARAAADDNIPIAILNVGPTRADDLATLRVGARSGEVFARLLNTGSLALPL